MQLPVIQPPANESKPGRIVSLPTDGIARVRGGTRLRVLHGMLWLTVDGQPDDHMLTRGDRMTLRRGDQALVQALDAQAVVELVEPAPASWLAVPLAWLQRAERRLAGLRT